MIKVKSNECIIDIQLSTLAEDIVEGIKSKTNNKLDKYFNCTTLVVRNIVEAKGKKGTQRKILEIVRKREEENNITVFTSSFDRDWLVANKDEFDEFFYNEIYNYFPEGLSRDKETLEGFVKSSFTTGKLIVLGSRPAIGKSALAQGFCLKNRDKSTLYISLEMSAKDLSNRFFLQNSGYKLNTLRDSSKRTEHIFKRLGEDIGKLIDFPLYINDKSDISIEEIRESALKLREENDLGLVVIDYLQLLGTKKEISREMFISNISRDLKLLSRELDVPILVLSQVNRSVEMRADKRPQLCDLRESGSIEQNADIVMMLYREGTNAELLIRKNRMGITRMIPLEFNPNILSFY